MIFALILLGVGSLFTFLAVVGWRHRSEESISLLEAAILKTTGEEPLPITWFDRLGHRLQLILMSILGPVLIALGLAGILIEMGVL